MDEVEKFENENSVILKKGNYVIGVDFGWNGDSSVLVKFKIENKKMIVLKQSIIKENLSMEADKKVYINKLITEMNS